jgi:PAS domain S-box-containing protein
MSDPRPAPPLAADLATLFEQAPCGYLSTALDGSIELVNETFLNWTGFARPQLLGRRFVDLLTRGGRIYHETHFAPLLAMQGAVSEIALEVVCSDGSRLPVLVNARAVAGVDTEARVAVVVFEARQRRAYEQELLRARRRETEERERVEQLQRLTQALAVALDAPAMAAATLEAAMEVPGATAARIDVDGEELGRRGEPPAEWTEELELAAGERSAGWLRVAFTRGEAERAFLLACARQCALGLERARRYEHEHRVADALQRSMLTGRLPEDPRFAIATYYSPAVELMAVGGDWYDAFEVPGGRLALVVGDVVGHGVGAASATGRVRGAVRALALAGFGVDRLLERLDAFVELDEPLWMATLAYAEIDLRAGQVRIATAGHPPPIIQRSGTAPGFVWEGRSAALGSYGQPAPRPHTTLAVRRGDRLVLYSDGLVERRGESIDVGLDRLLAHLAQEGATPLEKAVQALPHAIVPTRGRDDLCVLGVQYVGD